MEQQGTTRPLLTVFTSTYNRAHLLGRLYSSLLRQGADNFEWIIVDDGSTDETEHKVTDWIREAYLPIRYFRQPHGGKHRAINLGLQEAHGRYFLIVDSDDWLGDTAVKKVTEMIPRIDGRDDIISLQFRTMNPSGRLNGDHLPRAEHETDFLSLREKDRITGDMAEIFKADIFRERFLFPEIKGEDFMPEALVWNRMAKDYKVLLIDEPIYYVEYQRDGLSAKIVEKRHNSPCGAMLFYSELSANPRIPFFRRWRAAINYWRFADKGLSESLSPGESVTPIFSFVGRLMRKHDFLKFNKGNK